ncbi:MAG: lysophospholipid acyltransferase family protein [Bacteroidia bacterium]|nr:lysophospholipid acyltransferase family protein [Bacteroidia bacterium]MCX7651815.1 lysophospholipid acyltransferase family protein [Bacteroidia bacterium]MDW8417083.1 GNAT family N-acyltransferase [Bacteroidia bacterium]
MSRYERPLIELRELLQTPWQRVVYTLTGPWIEKALGIEKLNRFYALCEESGRTPGEFARRVLDLIGVQYVLPPPEQLSSLRAHQGPMIVVCNHPFGGIEAIFLVLFLSEIRADFKIIANFFLERVEEVKDTLLLVDPFGGNDAKQFNLQPIKQAIQYLRQGGLLGIFPSGEVASLHLRTGRIREPEWHPLVGRLIQQTEAAALPLYFHGTNSLLFHIAGLINPRLRTSLLIREFVSPPARKVHYRVGKVLPYTKLKPLGSAERITAYLRSKTYLLGESVESRRRRLNLRRMRQLLPKPTSRPQPIIPPIPPERILEELEKLPTSQRLVVQGEWRIYFFRGNQQPLLLEELGRLRETTFRAVGEGTNQAKDIDAYDTWYDHLILYNITDRTIAGAYRIGRCDEILRTRGLRGLYTYSLFHMKRSFFQEVSPALELGRAFIQEKYQRSFAPLYLLWRGIGQYVLTYPHYRYLIGPVSISSQFPDLSKALLAAFLEDKYGAADLMQNARGRTPYTIPKQYKQHYYTVSVQSLQDVQELIEELEGSHLKVPILIKHYLKLGARIVAFNIDHAFNDAMDILIVTDLLSSPPELMVKYLGEEGYATYLRVHGKTTAPSPQKGF